MKRRDLEKLSRLTAYEVLTRARPLSFDPRAASGLERAVEAAMNQEWWRGYYAAVDAVCRALPSLDDHEEEC